MTDFEAFQAAAHAGETDDEGGSYMSSLTQVINHLSFF